MDNISGRMGSNGGGDGLGVDALDDDMGDEMGYIPPPPPGPGGYPGGGWRGAPAPPPWAGAGGFGNTGVLQALDALRVAVRQTTPGNSGQLSMLQQSFDTLRNAMKAAFPSGGPHGPVG
jgi:hypothetical protein